MDSQAMMWWSMVRRAAPRAHAATYNTSTAASCPSNPTPQLLEARFGREVEAAQVGPVAGQRGHSQQGCQHGAGLKVFAALAGCRHRLTHLRSQSKEGGRVRASGKR